MVNARSYSLSELVTATGFDRRTIVYYIQSGLLPKVGRRGPHTRYPEDCLARLQFIKGVKALQTEGQLLTATLAEIRRALATLDPARIGDLLSRGLPAEDVIALFAEDGGQPTATAIVRPAQEEPAPPARGQIPFVATSPESFRGPAGERRSYGLADAGIRKRFNPDGSPGSQLDAARPTQNPMQAPTQAPTQAPAQTSTATSVLPTTESTGTEPELGELLRELEVRPTLNPRRSPPGAPEQWTEIPITSRVYLSVRGLSEDDMPLAEGVARLLKRALRTRTTTPST